jgi:O-antigen/teichoic acid export membrane protein
MARSLRGIDRFRGRAGIADMVEKDIPYLRRLVGNALSLLTSDVLNRATSFVIYALVARQLGAVAVGQVSLALTLFYVFQVLSVAGLKTLIIREVAKNRQDTERYLVNASLAVVIYSLVSMVMMGAFVRVMGYRDETAIVILLLSVGLLPYAMAAVQEAIFQAWERMHYIAYANAPMNALKIGLVIAVLALGYGVRELMIVIVIALFAIASFEWWLTARNIVRPRFRFDLGFAYSISRKATTFLGIDAVIAVRSAVPIVLLSKLASEREVGLFSVAQQLLVPIGLVFQAIALSVFPLLCRKFAAGMREFQQVGSRLLEVLMVVGLPTAVGLFLMADSALLLLYSDADFLNAVVVLRILVWLIVLNGLTTGLGHLLYAAGNERMTLRIVLAQVAVVTVLGIVMIDAMGLPGAALATVAAGFVSAALHFAAVWKVIPHFGLMRRTWIPAVACAVMWGYLEVIQWDHLAVRVVSGAIAYAVALIAVMVVVGGGPRQLKVRYLQLWSRS